MRNRERICCISQTKHRMTLGIFLCVCVFAFFYWLRVKVQRFSSWLSRQFSWGGRRSRSILAGTAGFFDFFSRCEKSNLYFFFTFRDCKQLFLPWICAILKALSHKNRGGKHLHWFRTWGADIILVISQHFFATPSLCCTVTPFTFGSIASVDNRRNKKSGSWTPFQFETLLSQSW